MILLMDEYTEKSRLLHESLKAAGIAHDCICVFYNGYLPDDVISPYAYYSGCMAQQSGRPKYFNELEIPFGFEIRGNNSTAQRYDYEKRRAGIFYAEPRHLRNINIVDYLNEAGGAVFSDHYNKYGKRFAQTLLDENQRQLMKVYFDKEGREVILENLVTGGVILTYEGKTILYGNKIDFLLDFIVKCGYDTSRVLYNSLSYPLFVSNRLPKEGCAGDLLFWQEELGDQLPGNMELLFQDESTRTTKIAVQSEPVYDKLQKLMPGNSRIQVSPLGFIYPFVRKNKGGKQVLIMTNSDRIKEIVHLVSSLSEVTFHIGALTEMSSTLRCLSDFSNVRLYESITPNRQDQLFEDCDLYLDINYEGEILDAVKTAFLHNQLIVAFQDTVHNRSYVAKENLFAPEAGDLFCEEVRHCLSDPVYMEEKLERQRRFAMAENKERYLEVING